MSLGSFGYPSVHFLFHAVSGNTIQNGKTYHFLASISFIRKMYAQPLNHKRVKMGQTQSC